MTSLKVNDMNKYELTEAINKAKEILSNPETNFHFCGPGSEDILQAIEEIDNPVTDKEGYVHKFYLKEETKSLIEILTFKEK